MKKKKLDTKTKTSAYAGDEGPIVHLTIDELQKRLKISRGTLGHWRTIGTGPRFLKLGHKIVVYPLREVVAWENSVTFSNTTEAQR